MGVFQEGSLTPPLGLSFSAELLWMTSGCAVS
jgi:hypothetical protein